MAGLSYQPLAFADIPGWNQDDVGLALPPFAETAHALTVDVARKPADPILSELSRLSQLAEGLVAQQSNSAVWRDFFEQNFVANHVVHDGSDGLLTGYYEPELAASRTATERFKVPLYLRPDDLADIVGDDMRGSLDGSFTHGRRVAGGVEPYATRQDIEQGALAGRGLEFLYLEDPVDAFFLHVQGSGLAVLPDGGRIRIGYDGKNGHPYTSVGRYLAEKGAMPLEDVTLDALKAWLHADPERGRRAMWQNKSFIFFKELGPADAVRASGVKDIPLTPGRSLAVDAGCHQIGLPVFVSAPSINFYEEGERGFARLMVAQDVGSAIKGQERGDIFYGSGDCAGHLAGITKHRGNFFVLLPKGCVPA